MPYKAFDIAGLGTVKIYKRRGNRHLRLTVTADGSTRVTIPPWTPYQAGIAFALSRKDWVMAQANKRQVDVLVNGLAIGKAHHLVFRQDPTATAIRTSVRDTEIVITYGPTHSSTDHVVQTAARSASERALRRQAKQLLSLRLRQLASDYTVSYRSFTVKRLTSRWGSCDQQGNVVLNIYLVQLPWPLIDYVILHELAHTMVLHHGPRFWQQLERLLPEAKQRRKAMKAYRPGLLLA